MFKHDADFLWRPGRVYIPAWSFTGLDYEATTANDIKSIGSGAANDTSIAEINSLGITGLLMGAAGNEVNHLMLLPGDLDLSKPIRARVHWTSGSTDTADTVTWKVRYLKVVPNVTELVSAATDLDTAIAADDVPVATAYVHAATEWGIINANSFAENVEAIQWEVEMDAFDAGLSESKFFLGLELAYTPKKLAGPDGMKMPAKLPTFMLGKTYAN